MSDIPATGVAFKLTLIRTPSAVRYEATDGVCPVCGAICERQNVNGRLIDDASYQHCTNPGCGWSLHNPVWAPPMVLGEDHEALLVEALREVQAFRGTTSSGTERDQRQTMIADWARLAFGHDEATSLPQRGIRLLEETIEAFQAVGGAEDKAIELVKYVFARPAGKIGQELGGVAVTTLALAAAAGLSADEEERREVQRVLNKPLGEFTARNAAKNAAGFLVAEGKTP
jgi:NTP pyrophosphatase (non-canonical NTP hydrolase)